MGVVDGILHLLERVVGSFCEVLVFGVLVSGISVFGFSVAGLTCWSDFLNTLVDFWFRADF